MSWRFLATSALGLVLALSGTGRGQDNSSPSQEKPGAQSTSGAEKPTTAKAKVKKSSTRSRARSAAADSSSPPESRTELATFGAGCFWHVEATFERLPGVVSAVSGYAGGSVPNPTYEMVHEGITGHAEVVMVQYDPEVISYEQLLKVFWSSHDPTTPNRQGPDVGTQYRSIILYHDEAQRRAALHSYQELMKAGAFANPIVTQLVPLRAFYRAEDYHQDYYGGKPRTTVHHRKTAAAKSKKTPAKTARPAATAKPANPASAPDAAAPDSAARTASTDG
jgi:peptide-methionine (S)-S-oxide reductase